MKNTNKKGFTLIELMVVVIIVAILAAVALPLMTGNRARAISSEAHAGCGTIATTLRLLLAENNGVFEAAQNGDASDVNGISAADLDGTYFDADDYVISNADADAATYLITATGDADSGRGEHAGDAEGIVVTLNQDGDDTVTLP